MQQLGVGIVGAGIMGRAHANILADHPATRVAAVTSRTLESADKLAGEYGARVHPDVAGLVTDPAVDIVVVATPDHLHADTVCAAADAGRHVLVYASAVDGRLRELGVDTPDAIQAQCRFRGGAVATFESCWTYPDTFPTMTDSFVEVVGERGVIHLDRKCEQIEIATDERYEYPLAAVHRSITSGQPEAVR
jgi:predicted dehydrogenase